MSRQSGDRVLAHGLMTRRSTALVVAVDRGPATAKVSQRRDRDRSPATGRSRPDSGAGQLEARESAARERQEMNKRCGWMANKMGPRSRQIRRLAFAVRGRSGHDPTALDELPARASCDRDPACYAHPPSPPPARFAVSASSTRRSFDAAIDRRILRAQGASEAAIAAAFSSLSSAWSGDEPGASSDAARHLAIAHPPTGREVFDLASCVRHAGAAHAEFDAL